MLAAEFGTGQVFWSMLWFTLFFVWIWIAVAVFSDIFRSPDLSGWGKALWTLLVVFVPYFGVFMYLIVRGTKMAQHGSEAARARDQMGQVYAQNGAAATPTDVDQLTTLASLREQGVIDDVEFQRMKAKVTAA